MLFVTNGQLGVFLAFVWLGAVLKIIYDLTNLNSTKFKIIYDFFATTLAGFFFILFVHFFNLGQFRLFLVLGFVIGVLFTTIFATKTLAQIKNLLYNIVIEKLKFFKNLRKKAKKHNENKAKIKKTKQNSNII